MAETIPGGCYKGSDGQYRDGGGGVLGAETVKQFAALRKRQREEAARRPQPVADDLDALLDDAEAAPVPVRAHGKA